MLKRITGAEFIDMIQYGISHLSEHSSIVNDLNVFPVPDGDTGTNMVMTMENGFRSLHGSEGSLSGAVQSFANATVFGARGNSGVIISQFFKGLSESLKERSEADCHALAEALENGCSFAYAAVAKPVEGTILTVLREATDAVKEKLPELRSINDVIETFLMEAKRSLENTPNLLPILAKAGVVDSGGSGLVYFFEGIRKYLNGDPLVSVTPAVGTATAVDFSRFHKDSDFSLGYCTEVLLQLTAEPASFDYGAFVSALEGYGDSIVSSLDGDKVKLHIHASKPEAVLAFCHTFGEFLSLKIENMSVQHSETAEKLLLSREADQGAFAVVTVAPNPRLQKMLSEMGADVSILSREVPSAQDFIDAFDKLTARNILVFPNSSNSILSAMQAGSLHKKAKITVLNCRSFAECYAALAIMDFGSTDISDTVDAVNDTIRNLYQVSVVHASKNIKYGDRTVVKNDYFALSGNDILLTAGRFEDAVLQTVDEVLATRECSVITLFYGRNISEARIESLAVTIGETHGDVELCILATEDPIYDTVLSFE